MLTNQHPKRQATDAHHLKQVKILIMVVVNPGIVRCPMSSLDLDWCYRPPASTCQAAITITIITTTTTIIIISFVINI